MGMLSSALATRKTVASAYFAHSTATMAEIARLLGKQTERTKYLDLNSKIKKAFAAEYISPDGKLSPSLQGIYVLALQFELVPPNLRQKAVDRLVTMIHDNNDCLDTGFLSVPHLLDVLCANGHRVLATKLLHQTNYPSWLYEIKNGATTIWESWKAIEPSGKVTDMSYNHYAFGACGDWIYRELGGIQALEPGYQRVRIAPEPDGKLNFVKASYRSVHGEISVFWKIEGEKMRVEATVPCNTRAVIRLPKAKLGEVTESGSPLDAASGISNARQEHDAVEMDAGSGTYSFDYNYS